jgi:DNA-binding CsgD family transcriptional regulator
MGSLNTSLAVRTALPPVAVPDLVTPGRLSDQARLLYRWLSQRGPTAIEILNRLALPDLDRAISELAALGLLRQQDHVVSTRPYSVVLHDLLIRQSRMFDRVARTVTEGQRVLQILIQEHHALSGDATETVQTIDPPDAPEGWTQQPLRAQHRLATLNPAPDYPDDVLGASLARAAEDIERGVVLQTLHQRSMLAHPRRADYLWRLEQLGVQVRLREHLPFRMMICDDRVAGCSVPSAVTSAETFLLRGQRLVTLLGRLFETLWLEAEPLPAPGDEQRPSMAASLTAQHLTILRCLADGATDQTVARALGITPRTVTRRLNEIYDALGVQSRFQAGSAARRMGLV